MQSGNLAEELDRFKAALFTEIQRNGSSGYTQDEYRELRNTLKQHPELRAHLPEWLRQSATLRELVSTIRYEAGDQHGKWKRCEDAVKRGLNPLIAILEGADVTAAAHYERLELIGSGGFGEVYRYRHKLLERDFAFKVVASVTASRRLQFATRCCARHWRQPPRRSGFGTRNRPCSLHQGR